jgi:DNA-binding NarL/FixJ family response regulator
MAELLEVERALAGVMSLGDLAGPISTQIQRLAGASGWGVFHFLEPQVVSIQEGQCDGVLAGYTPDLVAEDLTQQFNLATPPTTFIPNSEGFDIERFMRSRPYTDFYRPRDIGDMRGIWPTGMPYGAPQMFGLLLYTPSVSRRFVAQRLDQVRRLELPFRTLARRVARFRALQQTHGILHQLLERQRGAFVLWDADGRLILMSATAQKYLGGALSRSELEHAATLALRQLRRAETSGRDAFLGRPRQLRTTRGSPLLVEFSWISAADRRPWLLAELQSCSGSGALLAQLSRAEVRVLRLLALGLSNREISEQLIVSRETVRTHVKHIFSKLGVSSRAKAARIAGEVWATQLAAVKLEPSTRTTE